jgi:hypothetical protein
LNSLKIILEFDEEEKKNLQDNHIVVNFEGKKNHAVLLISQT